MPSAGTEEVVPVVPGPHDLHRRRSQDWHQGVPVPVQTEEMELQHRGQHVSVWTGDADRWVCCSVRAVVSFLERKFQSI